MFHACALVISTNQLTYPRDDGGKSRADLEWSQMGKSKRTDKRGAIAHKKREGPPSPLKVGRPPKRNSGKAGTRTQLANQAAEASRVGAWKRKVGTFDTELRARSGETWSYDAIRLFLFMIVKGIQECAYTTWQGAKEAITSSIGMVHRVSGASVGLLKERWSHYSAHGEILVGDSTSRGNASVPLVEELRQLSPAHYAEVRAHNDGYIGVT